MTLRQTYQTLDRQIHFLEEALLKSQLIKRALELSMILDLPNWYIGAGAIAQTYWNATHNLPLDQGIKDIDLVYFDPNLSQHEEEKVQSIAAQHFKDLKVPVDIKNQARVHLWYHNRFGKKIEAYSSSEEAISQWPTTATSIGITLVQNNLKVFAPYGLSDLLGLIVRPNKATVTKEVYVEKTSRWLKLWKYLQIHEW